jgi:hypothetical protein
MAIGSSSYHANYYYCLGHYGNRVQQLRYELLLLSWPPWQSGPAVATRIINTVLATMAIASSSYYTNYYYCLGHYGNRVRQLLYELLLSWPLWQSAQAVLVRSLKLLTKQEINTTAHHDDRVRQQSKTYVLRYNDIILNNITRCTKISICGMWNSTEKQKEWKTKKYKAHARKSAHAECRILTLRNKKNIERRKTEKRRMKKWRVDRFRLCFK